MADAPWEQVPDGYRSTHNPDWTLSCVQTGSYQLKNQTTAATHDITARHGLYYALDVAEGVIHGGAEGTHERNILHAPTREVTDV